MPCSRALATTSRRYQKTLSSVVAEEDYLQHHNRELSVIAPANWETRGARVSTTRFGSGT